MLDLDKLVQDAKRSPSAKDAVIFLVQNIAILVNDAAGDQSRNKDLADQLDKRAHEMANSVIDNRDVTPRTRHEDPHRDQVVRAEPNRKAVAGDGPSNTDVKRDRDTPKPRLK